MKTLVFLIALISSAFAAGDDFYSQYLKTTPKQDYSPTVQYSIQVDEHGNNVVAAMDDPNLKFNYLWMKSYEPGYRSFSGPVALREIIRQYMVAGYKQERFSNAETFKNIPDENGEGKISNNFAYRFIANGPELKFRIQYNFN